MWQVRQLPATVFVSEPQEAFLTCVPLRATGLPLGWAERDALQGGSAWPRSPRVPQGTTCSGRSHF